MMSTAAVSVHCVCGTSVGCKVRKDVQTVPRRIKLYRAGMPFSKPLPQLPTYDNRSIITFQIFQDYNIQFGTPFTAQYSTIYNNCLKKNLNASRPSGLL